MLVPPNCGSKSPSTLCLSPGVQACLCSAVWWSALRGSRVTGLRISCCGLTSHSAWEFVEVFFHRRSVSFHFLNFKENLFWFSADSSRQWHPKPFLANQLDSCHQKRNFAWLSNFSGWWKNSVRIQKTLICSFSLQILKRLFSCSLLSGKLTFLPFFQLFCNFRFSLKTLCFLLDFDILIIRRIWSHIILIMRSSTTQPALVGLLTAWWQWEPCCVGGRRAVPCRRDIMCYLLVTAQLPTIIPAAAVSLLVAENRNPLKLTSNKNQLKGIASVTDSSGPVRHGASWSVPSFSASLCHHVGHRPPVT